MGMGADLQVLLSRLLKLQVQMLSELTYIWHNVLAFFFFFFFENTEACTMEGEYKRPKVWHFYGVKGMAFINNLFHLYINDIYKFTFVNT